MLLHANNHFYFLRLTGFCKRFISFHDVFKVSTSTGNVLLTVPVGNFNGGLAFDGVNIWVAYYGGVTKLRATDGKILGTFPASGTSLAFDGANIWVAGGDSVIELRAADGKILGNFPITVACSAAACSQQASFDGANVWVLNADVEGVSKF